MAEISAKFCSECGGQQFSDMVAEYLPLYSEAQAAHLTPKGRKIYERAYAGDAEAMCEYGQLLRAGEEGADGDLSYAYEWFMCAARCGCAEGYYLAGMMQNNAEIIWSSLGGTPAEAAPLFAAGAKMGHARCMYMLGWYYLIGRGVKKNDFLAAKYLGDAVAAGDKEAMRAAAKCHLEGSHGFEHSPEKAEALYRKAGDIAGMYAAFRHAYLFGEGLPKDPAMAAKMGDKYLEELLRLYRTSKQKGVACSHAWSLGQEYLQRGDTETAVKWFRQAAADGDPMGTIELTKLHRT